MDNGNNAETVVDQNQPADSVVLETEGNESTPQDSDTGGDELYVEVEGDQEKPKSRMTQEQAYAAWKKEKSKRQEKDEVINELKREVDELKQFRAQTARGVKPTLANCDGDEELYEQRLDEWYKNAPAQAPKAKKSDTAPTSDEAEFYLHHKEQELAEKLPDYAEAKGRVAEVLQAYAPEISPNVLFNNLAEIARQSNVDISKAIYAMDKVDGLAAELNQAAATRGQFGIADVLRKAADKVKTREKKPIETSPESELASSGSVDVINKEVENARKKYGETGSLKNYQALVRAKAKLKK